MSKPMLLTNTDTKKAKQIWLDYQRSHDVSNLNGQTVSVDPQSGQVWLGDSIQSIVKKREDAGLTSPLIFERIGSNAYYCKSTHS